VVDKDNTVHQHQAVLELHLILFFLDNQVFQLNQVVLKLQALLEVHAYQVVQAVLAFQVFQVLLADL
jgi:hypothetical protein